MISALTRQRRLLVNMQERAFCGADIVRFLRQVLRQVPGKLLIIWDGAPIHRGQAVQRFLGTKAGRRIWLERLPSYAPELNAAEGIWHYLKQVELGNVCCRTPQELRTELRRAVARVRHKPHVLAGCIKQCHY